MTTGVTWRLLNTRPSERATALTQELAALGVSVRELPLLTLTELPITAVERAYLQQLSHYDVVVCVSPTAVERGVALCQQQGIDYRNHRQAAPTPIWIAVGQRTCDTLAAHYIYAQQPLIMNNEGMLAMPAVDSLAKQSRVLIWRGEGGRRLLHDTLVARGVQVDSIAFYVRERPEMLSKQYDDHHRWANAVLISSGQAWQHWQTVCDAVDAYAYVVLGERVTQQVRSRLAPATVRVAQIESLSAGEIAHALASLAPYESS